MMAVVSFTPSKKWLTLIRQWHWVKARKQTHSLVCQCVGVCVCAPTNAHKRPDWRRLRREIKAVQIKSALISQTVTLLLWQPYWSLPGDLPAQSRGPPSSHICWIRGSGCWELHSPGVKHSSRSRNCKRGWRAVLLELFCTAPSS